MVEERRQNASLASGNHEIEVAIFARQWSITCPGTPRADSYPAQQPQQQPLCLGGRYEPLALSDRIGKGRAVRRRPEVPRIRGECQPDLASQRCSPSGRVLSLNLRFERRLSPWLPTSSLGRNFGVRAGEIHSLSGSDKSGSKIERDRKGGQDSETEQEGAAIRDPQTGIVQEEEPIEGARDDRSCAGNRQQRDPSNFSRGC